MRESAGHGVRTDTDHLLSEHELAQERLYRLWRAGWVRDEHVLPWAQSLERLQAEGQCDYIVWLLQHFPPLSESDNAESEGPVRPIGWPERSETLPGGDEKGDCRRS